MAVDKGLVAALSAALERDPTSASLRLQLASALTEGGEHESALEHVGRVLQAEPEHREALALAAEACGRLGRTSRAQAYREVLERLGARPGRQKLRVIEAADRFAAREEQARIRLADVQGMQDVKRRLELAFLAPLRDPQLAQAYKKSLRGGLLLYGPPGCGKTFIARALAGELGCRFVAVALSDVLDMWFGESERKLHEIFETARSEAPSVLFFDEIDALGHKRSQLGGHAGRNLVNSFLAELDGVKGDNKNVFVLAATNHPWDVDTALRRPGRFDRLVVVLPPDEAAREATLGHYLEGRPLEPLELGEIARATKGFSGADLARLCEAAAELAMESSLESGQVRPIAMTDLRRALKESRSSVRAWFETAKYYVQFANQAGDYDELARYIEQQGY